MAYDIGPKVGIEGEAEFKKAIADINRNLKTMGTEMKAVTSAYDSNDKSVEKLAAQNEVLNKQIEAQRNKLNELKSMLDKSKAAYGENDAQTQKYQQAVNLATADLNKMERELKNNEAALDGTAKGLEDAGKAADDSGARFEKLGGALKASAVAMGAVVVAAGAAAIGLGKEVIKQFGELEQNLGGSEAVFGEYAKSIQKTGEDAYKNLGVSQSDYLATANKMGALFQGSGIEQRKSLELTEKAMQRAADMASVMGIDMQVALDSVAGAAKGNFTMMDNLGVAMNETAIKAYQFNTAAEYMRERLSGLDFFKTREEADKFQEALQKTGGSTKEIGEVFKQFGVQGNNAAAAMEEMDYFMGQLDTASGKAEVAMQMFFDKTAQYEGNFAKESTETISGSIGLWKAALGSFTAGLGNADADMQKLTANLVDAFKAVVKNVVPIIENLTGALPEAFDAMLGALGELLPTLLNTVTSLFQQVLTTLLKLLPELIPVAVDAVMTIVDTIIENLPLIIDGAFELITALAEGLIEALPELVPKIVEVVTKIVETIIKNLPLIIGAALQIIIALASGLIKAIPTLVSAVPTLITSIVTAFAEGLETIKEIGVNIVKGIWEGITGMAGWLASKVKGFVDGIVSAFTGKDGIDAHSPSKLFATFGGYMAQGIGEGFTAEMQNVARQINGSIPTIRGSYDISGNLARGNFGAGVNQTVNIYSPTPLTPSQIARESKNAMRRLSWA